VDFEIVRTIDQNSYNRQTKAVLQCIPYKLTVLLLYCLFGKKPLCYIYYVLTPTFSPTLTICKGHLLTSIIRLFLQFQWQVNQSTSIKYARQPLVTVNMPMGHVLLGTSTCGVSFVTVKVPEFILVDIYIYSYIVIWTYYVIHYPYHRSISSGQSFKKISSGQEEPYHTIYLYSCINESWRLYGGKMASPLRH